MKVEIDKTENVIGLKKTNSIDISVEGDKELIDKIESVVKKVVAEGMTKGSKK